MPRKQPSPGPPAEVEIAFLLSRLGSMQANAFAELLGPLGLRPKQFAVMNIVALADGPSQQQIGKSMGLDPSGLIGTLDELESQGWLERRQSAHDRRRNEIHLTDAGATKLGEGRAAAKTRAEELTAPLSKKDRQALLRLLRILGGTGAE